VDTELEVSRTGFVSQHLTAVWTADPGRFEVDGEPLDGLEVVLRRDPLGDRDADGRVDLFDNCPTTPNFDQTDLDGDASGDACDPDRDGDGIGDAVDVCPELADPDQRDPDGDGRGLACDGADRAAPWRVGRRLLHLKADTRTRTNALRGSCGGARAAELAFEVHLESGEQLRAEANASFTAVWYVLDSDGAERACSPLDPFHFRAPRAGLYTVVLDGLTATDEGPADVSMSRDGGQWFSEPVNHALGGPLADLTPVTLNQTDQADLLTLEPDAGRMLRLRSIDQRRDNTRFTVVQEVEGLGRPVAVTPFHRRALGDQNVAVVDEEGDRVVILASDLRDELLEVGSYDVGDGPISIVSADLDGDGLPDLVVGNGLSHDLSVLWGTSADPAAFEPAIAVPLAFEAAPTDLAVGDLDLDGHLDIVVGAHAPNDGGFLMIAEGADGPTFAPTRTVNTFYRTGVPTLELADLNGDGALDLVAGWTTSGTVLALLNDGQARFTLATELALGLSVRDLAVQDLDLDGDLDVIVAGDDGLRVLVNDGDGGLTGGPWLHGVGPLRAAAVTPLVDDYAPTLFTVDTTGTFAVWPATGGIAVRRIIVPAELGLGAGYVVTGDINGDELPDLAPSGDSGDGVQDAVIALSNAEGTWTSSPVGCGARAVVAMADLDDDGDTDLISVTTGQTPTRLVVCHQRDGVFTEAGAVDLPGVLEHARLGEFGPPRGTTLIGSTNIQSFAIPFGDDGVPGAIELIHTGISPLAVADFDGDGTDEAILRVGGNYARWNGTQTPIVRRGASDLAVTLIEVVDFDGDGRPDLVEAGREVNAVRVLVQRDDGSLDPIASATIDAPVSDLGVLDLDGDGHRDLVIRTNNAATLTVLPGVGGGVLGAPFSFPGSGALTFATFRGRWLMTVGGTAPTILREAPHLALDARAVPSVRLTLTPLASFGDVDGDGLTDAVMTSTTGVLLALAGDRGPLSNVTALQAPASPGHAVPLPVRPGALPDLVMATVSGQLTIARNLGDGAFDAPTSLSTNGPSNAQLLPLDADGDGDADLLALGGVSFAGAAQLWLNPGDGTFVAGTFPAVNAAPIAAATGDLNGDGRDDVALCQPSLLIGPSTLTVITSTGATGWTALPLPQLDRPAAAWIGDLDRDGDNDLAVALEGQADGQLASLLLYTNPGTGQLGSPRSLPLPWATHTSSFPPLNPFASSLGLTGLDLDGDGAIELIATSASSSHAVVLSARDAFAVQRFITAPGSSQITPARFGLTGPPDLGLVTTTGIAALINTSGAEGDEAHLLDADLPPCPPLQVPGVVTDHGVTFNTGTNAGCRVDRITLELVPVAASAGTATVELGTSLLTHRVKVGPFDAAHGPVTLTARTHPALAQLAGAPAAGRWDLTLRGLCDRPDTSCRAHLASARLTFNARVSDPPSSARCDDLDDAPDTLAPPCAWDRAPLDAHLGDPDDDADHLALDRTFPTGTILHVTVESTAPVTADLRLTGARRPLLRTLATAPGRQESTLVIDARTAGRTLSIVLSSAGAPADYTVSLDTDEP